MGVTPSRGAEADGVPEGGRERDGPGGDGVRHRHRHGGVAPTPDTQKSDPYT